MILFICLLISFISIILIITSTNKRLFSPPLIFCFFYIAFFQIWALFPEIATTYGFDVSYLKRPNYQYNQIMMTMVLFLFSMGVVTANRVYSFKPKNEYRAFVSDRWIDDINWPEYRFAFLMILFFSIGVVFVFFKLKGIPLMAYKDAIYNKSGIYSAMGEARIGSQRGSGYLLQGVTLFLPFCSTILLMKYNASRKNLHLLSALALSSLTVFSMLLLTSRGHFAIFFVILLMAQQLYSKKINYKILFRFLLLFIALFVLVTLFREGLFRQESSEPSILHTLGYVFFYRFSQPYYQLINTFELYSNTGAEFFFGLSYLKDIIAILPGAQLGFNGMLYLLLYPGGTIGTAATVGIVGEAFCNFGIIGVLMIPFFWGTFMQWFYIKYVRSIRRLSTLVYYTFMSTYLAKAAGNGIGAILSEPVISISCLYILYKFTAQYFRYLMKKEQDSYSLISLQASRT